MWNRMPRRYAPRNDELISASLGHFADSPIGVDRPHDFDELPVIHRFGHIAGHPQSETCYLVLLLLGRGQHDHRNGFQLVIVLHHLHELDAVHDGHVEVEQDNARLRTGGVAQVIQGFLSVFQRDKWIRHVDLLQGARDRHDVHLIVFHQENGFVDDLQVPFPLVEFAFAAVLGSVKKKVLPSPTLDSIQMRPPYISTIFLTSARPTPVLSTRSRGASVWDSWKIFSKWRGSMPGPLSVTLNLP